MSLFCVYIAESTTGSATEDIAQHYAVQSIFLCIFLTGLWFGDSSWRAGQSSDRNGTSDTATFTSLNGMMFNSVALILFTMDCLVLYNPR